MLQSFRGRVNWARRELVIESDIEKQKDKK